MEAGKVEKTNCLTAGDETDARELHFSICVPHPESQNPMIAKYLPRTITIIKHPLARFFLLDQIRGVSAPCRASLLELWNGAQQCAQNLSLWQELMGSRSSYSAPPNKNISKHIKTISDPRHPTTMLATGMMSHHYTDTKKTSHNQHRKRKQDLWHFRVQQPQGWLLEVSG